MFGIAKAKSVTKPILGLMGLMLLWPALSGCGTSANNPNGVSAPTLPGQPAASSLSVSPDAQKKLKHWMDIGNAEAKAKRWPSALSAFQQVLSINPDYAPAHVQLGWIYAELKQWDDAKTHLIRAIALSPQQAGAHANLAWVYAEKGRWNDARQAAGKAIDLDPKNPYAHATLAWAYQKTNQDSLAISEYEKSLELKPDLENSRFALGMAYCNQGVTIRAKEQLSWLNAHHSSQAADLKGRVGKGCYPKK
jgi:tetratricopeptide (TPR) repeat protein